MLTSLVLPCYKPVSGWEQNVFISYRSFSEVVNTNVELILVIDGQSPHITDSELSFLRQNIEAIKIVNYSINRGKGYALRQGVGQAAGDIIMYTDIDFPYALQSMDDVFDALLSDQCDVAVGVKNASYYDHVPYLRRVISRFLRVLIKLFLSMPITDTQCGLKGFKRSVAPAFLHTTIDRYLFDLEFIYTCFKSKKYKVKAIPVELNENVRFRKMDYRILLPEMANFIRLLFK